MSRFFLTIGLLLGVASGCESAECTRMRDCCAAISDREWVGDACGSITDELSSPRSCAAVTSAIEVAASQRKQELPAVCQ